MDELASQLSATECVCCTTPVPDRLTDVGEPVAVLTIETLPAALPDDAGVKSTEKAVDCDGDKVTGTPAPLREKFEPELVICEIVTFEFPVFEIVTFCEEEAPVFTLPKLMLAGVTEIVAVDATPEPLSVIVVGEFGALLVTTMLPEALPADCGANCTLKFAVCPAFNVSGTAISLVL